MIQAFRMRPVTWFLVLLLFNLLLLSLQIRNPDGTVLLRTWGLFVISPLASALHFSTSSASDLLYRYVLLSNAARENRNLKEENERLHVEINRLRGLTALVPRLRDFRDLRAQYEFDWVAAAIIGFGDNGMPPFFIERMSISKGSLGGVRVDAAVFRPEGLVGRVYAVNPLSSEVQLLTAEGAATGVVVVESGLQGILLGNGTSEPDLDFIPNSETVSDGQLLVTSGTDRVYPKGIPVGRILRSENGPMIYKQIQVKLLSDFQHIEEVLVETGGALQVTEPKTTGAGEADGDVEVP